MATRLDPDLEARIAPIRETVDARLDRLVPPEDAPPETLHRAMRYSLLAPGKRIRPVISILAAEALGAPPGAALEPGCAVEMVHTASLILDDLPSMDNAAVRRGRKANHVEFGQDIATLAAVSLLNRAYGVLASAPGVDAAVRLELVATLVRCIGDGGIVEGQVHDLQLNPLDDPKLAEMERMAGQKTSALFVAAAEIGARVAGATAERIESVRQFGWDLGLCFQVLDDLKDIYGTRNDTGKDVGQDTSKATFVSLMGPERASEAAERFALDALRALAPLGPSTESLVALVDFLVQRARALAPHR